MNDVMSESIARDRFFTMLFLLFGGLALGARTIDVLRMVVGGGMRLVVIGIALGALTSLLLTRALASLLFEVSTTDPLAFVTALAVLTAVALLACYLPARRATRIDPVAALRAE